jgi:hypothetical protein
MLPSTASAIATHSAPVSKLGTCSGRPGALQALSIDA